MAMCCARAAMHAEFRPSPPKSRLTSRPNHHHYPAPTLIVHHIYRNPALKNSGTTQLLHQIAPALPYVLLFFIFCPAPALNENISSFIPHHLYPVYSLPPLNTMKSSLSSSNRLDNRIWYICSVAEYVYSTQMLFLYISSTIFPPSIYW